MEASLLFSAAVLKDHILLPETDKFSIGRSSSCSLTFGENKFLSAVHCMISKDENGVFLLTDLSSNGTVINGCTKLNKGDKVSLKHGDVVYLVKQRSYCDELAFTFQLKLKTVDNNLKRAEDDTEQCNTLSLDTENQNVECTKVEKRKACRDASSSLEPKMPRIEQISDALRLQEKGRVKDTPHISSESSTGKVFVPFEQSSQAAAEAGIQSTSGNSEMEKTLLCSICCEIIHDCISLQPCMHSFCSGCYSEWLSRSYRCPDCRNAVEKISKNCLINNVIEAYLKEHPEKKRSEDDIEELDGKNKITHDMLFPKRKKETEESPESDFSETDSGSDDDNGNIYGFHFGAAAAYLPPPRIKCRQCPGYTDSGGASRSDVATPPFLCQQTQDHILCQCCLQPMPNRSQDPQITALPPIRCSVCHRHFCNMYWGCRKQGCLGCLNHFRGINFGDTCLAGIVLENGHESQILSNYLRETNRDWKSLLQECIAKLEQEEYSALGIGALHITADTVLCNTCGLKQFRELAYQYRKDIPKEALPADVTARPDCYWGRNCRTQKNKPLHAQRFNHICNQTRFT